MLDAQTEVGLVGIQVTGDDELWPTIRRFQFLFRAFGEALFSERWPVHPADRQRVWTGAR